MTIYGMSGQPKYLENKVRFLISEGVDVFVFSALKFKFSKLMINLDGCCSQLIPALMYAPSYFRKSEIDNIVRFMSETINCKNGDDIYVESNAIASAEWGEMLAKEVRGKHISFNLQERFNFSEGEIDFLRFKLNRKELSGIAKTSVQDMLKDKSIQFEDWMRIAAYCNNVVADCEDKFSEMLWKDVNLTFGSIGRLEKSCVLPLLKGIIEYCLLNTGKYNIVMIGGGSSKGGVKKIRNLVANYHNINLIITDNIYPIPRSLLQNIDIFISTAGSAGVSFYEKRSTIKVHPITGKPVGIVGYTFTNKNSMFDSSSMSLVKTIKQVIEEKDKIVYDNDYIESRNKRMKDEFQRQLGFFENSNKFEYYDTRNICPKKSFKSTLFYIMGKILGSEKMQKILNTLRSLL